MLLPLRDLPAPERLSTGNFDGANGANGKSTAMGQLQGGDVLDRVELDRGGFACALGGHDRQTLYILATKWNGPENMFKGERTGQLLTVAAPAPAAGWPGR
jgi:sugar lactone lactonase YvrE